VDRARAPETEAWLFSTYEVRLHKSSEKERCGKGDADEEGTDEEEAEEAKSHLLALFRAVSSLPPNRDQNPSRTLILGSLHSALVPLLAGPPTHTLTPRAVIARSPDSDVADAAGGGAVLSQISTEYGKWLIPATTAAVVPPEKAKLPRGYVFAALEAEDLCVVMARTEIPKTVETLARLRGVGVREVAGEGGGGGDGDGDGDGDGGGDGRLVAWGFVGVDGCLSTLHVEPGERGKGLGKAVAGRLVGMVGESKGEGGGEGGGGGEDGRGWVSGDVAVGTERSEGVMRGVGGKRGWTVRWVAVDLERL